jgi:hypothetical protein
MELHTKFDYGQKVTIKELNTPGKIVSIIYEGVAVIYKLEYWWNGETKICYQGEGEIKS